jgi:hypothetical protein
VFVGTTGLALAVGGTVLCCLPRFVGLALAQFAQYNLLSQLYRLYRERGGRAVVTGPAPVGSGDVTRP